MEKESGRGSGETKEIRTEEEKMKNRKIDEYICKGRRNKEKRGKKELRPGREERGMTW